MLDYSYTIYTECSTVGHYLCKKTITQVGQKWKLTQIEHTVYGKKYIEKF